MGKTAHLERRGAVYWYRRKVPNDVRHAFGGKREIRFSLGTKERAEALEVLPVHDLEWNARFRTARGLDAGRAREAVATWLDGADRQTAMRDFATRDPGAVEAALADADLDLAQLGGPDEVAMPLVQAVADSILSAQGFPTRAVVNNGPIGSLVQRREADVDKGRQDYAELCELVRRALVEAASRPSRLPVIVRARGLARSRRPGETGTTPAEPRSGPCLEDSTARH